MTLATPEPASTTPAAAVDAQTAQPALAVSASEQRGNTLPLVEETLRVDKVAVAQGGVRITKRVDTRDELVDEVLRDQRVEVERRPIGLPLDGDVPQTRYEGDTLIVPVIEEVLVTEKRLVLVEEVRITRIEGTHRQPQRVTLRKEEISIERFDAAEPPPESSYTPIAGG